MIDKTVTKANLEEKVLGTNRFNEKTSGAKECKYGSMLTYMKAQANFAKCMFNKIFRDLMFKVQHII